MEEFTATNKVAWIAYKGFTANDIQFALGFGPSETRGHKAGLHPIIVRWTHLSEPLEKRVPNVFIECFKWIHLCLTVDDLVMSIIINGELVMAQEIPGHIALTCAHGTNDLFIGAPVWEYETGVTPNAWLYMLNIFGSGALEPNEVLYVKYREESNSSREACVEFDPLDLGRSGVDQCPDPLLIPAAVKAVFDCRLVVASQAGVEVLTDLLQDPLEGQKRAAAEALKNLADPAVAAGMRKVVETLMVVDSASGKRRIEAVYHTMCTCQEAATFEAVTELAANLLNWEPPVGEKGISERVRLELIKFMVLPPENEDHMEGRAKCVTRNLQVCIQIRRNVEHLAEPEVQAIDTFFKYLASKDSSTVLQTLELLIKLVTKSSSELRYRWAEEMCQSHHFQKLMQMVMRSGDRNIKRLYETLLNYVLKQCDQKKLMETVTSFSLDDITQEERFYISKILYGCLSAVEMKKETRTLAAPPLSEATLPKHASGVTEPIHKLQIKGAPGITVQCVPLPPKVGTVMTQVKIWTPRDKESYPVCENPNEIYIWIANSESELEQPVRRREIQNCVAVLCHTKPMPMPGQEVDDDDQTFSNRYKDSKAEVIACKTMEFADTVYYQVQFMSGKALLPFAEQDDAELLQEEPPRVQVRLVCDNMVMRDMTEAKAKANCFHAFVSTSQRKQSVAEYIFKQVEDVEDTLLQELQGDGPGEGGDDAKGDEEPESEEHVLAQDPAQLVKFQREILR
eukprot:TRINITY_DN74823_c0_g1_i1.p1 TRINITY_DN74823_c0_g1~~TRINITY_DN74823_c0_g1_i1.p1  ORF type:complete len:786 (-),score=219.46 TRINITY_DN74823_c0_g1_i1:44-2260(-)